MDRILRRRKTDRTHERRQVPVALTLGEKSTFCDNTVINSKYKWYTFLPFNLFEQFHRPINFYFLVIAFLQFIPTIAAVSPLTTVGPLLLAFSITAFKEGYDDFQRHKRDKELNRRAVDVVLNHTVTEARSEQLRVGDLVILHEGQEAYCDMIALFSSHDDRHFLVSTENLDGESEPKEKHALFGVAVSPVDAKSILEELRSKNGSVDSEGPNSKLSDYHGIFRPVDGSDPRTVGIENLIVASSTLRHTSFVLGKVVFTGNETKLGMTKQIPPSKSSRVDILCNRLAIGVFLLQFVLMITLGWLGAHATDRTTNVWYLAYGRNPPDMFFEVVVLPVRYFLLATLMVPISFKVVVDVSKAYVAFVIGCDMNMYDPEQECFCSVNNSSLAEDLGQIEYVLSDKTGTITENKMAFRGFVLHDGTVVEHYDVHSMFANTVAGTPKRYLLQSSLMCNTLQWSREANGWVPVSPDEAALLEAARLCDAHVRDRTPNRTVLEIGRERLHFEFLHVAKFTPDRRKMSVLLRCAGEDESLLLLKGSDDRVLPACSRKPGRHVDDALLRLAEGGLRTLAFAYRVLSKEDTVQMQERLQQADHLESAEARTNALETLYEELETGMTFCGASAVEDKLQDGARETIQLLRDANIRVWMITGDKKETAQQIALSSGLLDHDDLIADLTPIETLPETEIVAFLNDIETQVRPSVSRQVPVSIVTRMMKDFSSATDSVIYELAERLKTLGTRPASLSSQHQVMEESCRLVLNPQATRVDDTRSFTALLSGKSLSRALQNDLWLEKLSRILLCADTVVSCRTAPDQKARIVRLVRDAKKVTLAVGDGGNDVAMIQEAHVGVGVIGHEGRQAAMASDFSIGRFRFLATLVLVHGHYAVQRTSYLVQQSFYKSMLIAWVQMISNIYTMFSGVTFWNSFALTLWNGVYTVPLTFFYVMDVHLPAKVLLHIPSLYTISQCGRYLNPSTFFLFLLRAIVQGTVGFYAALFAFESVISSNGVTSDTQTQFVGAYGAFCMLVGLTMLIEAHSFVSLQWYALILCNFCAFYVTFFGYSFFLKSTDFYGSFTVLLTNWTFHLSMMGVLFLCLVPYALWCGLKFWFWPNALQLHRAALTFFPNVADNPSVFVGSFVPTGCRNKEHVIS